MRASSVARLISARVMSSSRLSRRFPGRFVPVGACDVEPHVRTYGILEDTLPVGVPDPEVELGTGVTLICGQPVPAHGIGIVFEDAPPVGVGDPEVELRIGETLVRRPAGTISRLRHCP